MNINGITDDIRKIIVPLSHLDCIRPFVLAGGTALSIQIDHRQSEDLDFMLWKSHHKESALPIGELKRDLPSVGTVERFEILGFDHVLFVVNGVKLSFYSAPRERPDGMKEVPLVNNIRLADIRSIGAMKLEVMSRRQKFRDYYDIYSILKEGVDLWEILSLAQKHSRGFLKERVLLGMLLNDERFACEKGFARLSPRYDVTPSDIANYIRDIVTARHETEREKIKETLADNAVLIKKESGVYALRTKIGERSYMEELTDEETKRCQTDKSAVAELAMQKLSDRILKENAPFLFNGHKR